MDNPFVLATAFLPIFGSVIGLLLTRFERAKRWFSFIVSLLAWGASLVVLIQVFNGAPQIYRLGGYTPPYGIVLVADGLGILFAVMSSTVMMAGLLYAVHCKDKCVSYPAFLPLFLAMETGLNGALLTGDIFSLFVFMEVMVLSSVTLVAIADDSLGLEAAIKYLLISGMGTLFLLLGIGSMYASFGTLNMADIAQQMASGERPFLAQGAAIMLVCAFLLKSAVFPFHFWQPDFHTTAPTPVHAVLSSVVVKIGVYGIIRLMTLLFTQEAALIGNLLVILGIVGIFYGSFTALRTYNGKRLLAYSTIGQIGFILVGIGWGTPLALTAAIVYAFNHALIKSALLMVMGLLSSRTYPKSADFADVGGAGTLMPPIIGALWLLGGMALAGVPPMNGFISKLAIVQGGIDAQQWLALFLAVGAGFLTLTYVMRTWQNVFQRKNPELKLEIKPYGDGVIAPVLLISLCVLFGIYATPLISIVESAVQQLGNPQVYIQAVGLFGG